MDMENEIDVCQLRSVWTVLMNLIEKKYQVATLVFQLSLKSNLLKLNTHEWKKFYIQHFWIYQMLDSQLGVHR